MKHNKLLFFLITVFGSILIIPLGVDGQSHNHWSRSFNEESSLLSGAVVGGSSGPSAIYYNPASISEITESKLSVNASLFSFDIINIKNALGDGIDLNSFRGKIEPRFLSYMIKPKKRPNWSFEIAFLNNENYKQNLTQSVDQEIDVLTHLPGNERYFALFEYHNTFRDDWIGGGGSWKINRNLSIGASMFISIRQLDYSFSLDIEAYPLGHSVFINNQHIPFYSANYQELEFAKYNDYRLLWKVGALYKKRKFSIGLNITTPSVGGIYSDGKKVSRKQKQSNITNPETGEPLPDYVLVDYKEKDEVTVNSKNPLSVAAGFNYYFADTSKIIYFTAEYFAGIEPYRVIEANENFDLIAGSVFGYIAQNEWLTFVSGAKPILNIGVGYQWLIKNDLLMMAGFRTDFNYRKKFNYNPYAESKQIKGLDVDMYHISAGLSWRILGQDLITGFQYTVGSERNQQQFANLSDPVEFNTEDLTALTGQREYVMDTFFHSISIYFGATFNFGGDNNK